MVASCTPCVWSATSSFSRHRIAMTRWPEKELDQGIFRNAHMERADAGIRGDRSFFRRDGAAGDGGGTIVGDGLRLAGGGEERETERHHDQVCAWHVGAPFESVGSLRTAGALASPRRCESVERVV